MRQAFYWPLSARLPIPSHSALSEWPLLCIVNSIRMWLFVIHHMTLVTISPFLPRPAIFSSSHFLESTVLLVTWTSTMVCVCKSLFPGFVIVLCWLEKYLILIIQLPPWLTRGSSLGQAPGLSCYDVHDWLCRFPHSFSYLSGKTSTHFRYLVWFIGFDLFALGSSCNWSERRRHVQILFCVKGQGEQSW